MVTNRNDTCFLEIGIPTYNRSRQLERLLTILQREIDLTPNDATIRITVSDNCSPDDTQMMLRSHSFRDNFVLRTNPENNGALRNISALYETMRADYAWIISDDDIPKPGSLQKILETLTRYGPTVLTFEFEQPPGSVKRWHGNRDGIEEITDLRQAIPHILYLGKLSKYVISAKDLQRALNNVGHLKSTGYGWLAVILEVIHLSTSKKIVIDHEFLVSCDDNYAQVTDGLTPQFWDDYLLLLDHEIVKSNCPEYAHMYRVRHYGYMVKIIYAVLAGMIDARHVHIFQEYGKILPFHTSYLRNPFVFLQWLSLRLNIPASLTICRMSEYPGLIKRGLFSRFWRHTA
jgi:glycosyltransferase involved in cell wall biosynthesis